MTDEGYLISIVDKNVFPSRMDNGVRQSSTLSVAYLSRADFTIVWATYASNMPAPQIEINVQKSTDCTWTERTNLLHPQRLQRPPAATVVVTVPKSFCTTPSSNSRLGQLRENRGNQNRKSGLWNTHRLPLGLIAPHSQLNCFKDAFFIFSPSPTASRARGIPFCTLAQL